MIIGAKSSLRYVVEIELLRVELVRKQLYKAILIFCRTRLRTGTFVCKGGKEAKKSNGKVLFVRVHVYRTSRCVKRCQQFSALIKRNALFFVFAF